MNHASQNRGGSTYAKNIQDTDGNVLRGLVCFFIGGGLRIIVLGDSLLVDALRCRLEVQVD